MTVGAAGGAGTPGRVLLTGAQGFTGEPLARALRDAGHTVVGTTIGDLATPSGDLAGIAFESLDIGDAKRCVELVDAVRPDYVVHLAAISFVQHADAADFYRINVVGTTNLLDALVAAGRPLRKVVLASSANIYGQHGGELIDERQPAAPANHYAASKMAMEAMAATYFERLPIVVTRPFNYTGPGQSESFLVPKIVSHFARGERTIELGNTEIERDFSDIDAVVSAYVALLASPARSQVFNICTGVPVSLKAIIAMMEEIAGYRIDVRVNPAFVRANDIRRLTGDPRALVAAIGPHPRKDFRETLRAMYERMRAA